MVKIPSSVDEGVDPSTVCPSCGARLEKTDADHLGCIVCLLRVGLDEQAEPIQAERVEITNQFGTYVIMRRDDGSPWELGRGAMGVTFRALDTSLNRAVALKIIETNGAGEHSAVRARFMREARAAAALRHGNVATVYQFGIREETGQCFYAMELIEGETLEERVRRTGPLKSSAVIEIALQVTAALAAAEKHGLIHRDLKPANLMLVSAESETTTAGQNNQSDSLQVKIIDFGLAKAIGSESDPMSLTRGGFAGTPAFASPEQFSGGPLDVRTDIYSLGSTLWFALTGKRPFGGRSVEEIRGAQRSQRLPVEQLGAAQASSGLISVLLAMLAFEPAARPTIQELSVRLQQCREPARIFGKQSRLLLTVGLLALLTASFFSIRSWRTTNHVHENGAAGAGSTTNPEAREAYLKGRYFWDKRTVDGFKKSGEYFKQAIALDPSYAQAYAGLGDSFHFLAGSSFDPQKDYFAKSKEAYRKALDLNPALAGAHASLGLVTMNYDWDWLAAEQEFKRTIELDPDYATGHHWYAECLIALGRFDEGLREIERARELEPLSLIINTDMGKMLYYSRRFDEAKKQLKETLNLDPNFAEAHLWLAWVYTEQKEFEQAIAAFQAYGQLSGDKGVAADLGFVYARMGKRKEALETLESLKLIGGAATTNVCLGLGDRDCALAGLEVAYGMHDTAMTSLKVAPFYDSLRSDPRFVDLMRRVHLTP